MKPVFEPYQTRSARDPRPAHRGTPLGSTRVMGCSPGGSRLERASRRWNCLARVGHGRPAGGHDPPGGRPRSPGDSSSATPIFWVGRAHRFLLWVWISFRVSASAPVRPPTREWTALVRPSPPAGRAPPPSSASPLRHLIPPSWSPYGGALVFRTWPQYSARPPESGWIPYRAVPVRGVLMTLHALAAGFCGAPPRPGPSPARKDPALTSLILVGLLLLLLALNVPVGQPPSASRRAHSSCCTPTSLSP